ncbi:MAG: hypothetical protein ACFFA0_00670 [Promethearchaeota archaeon]
MKISRKNRPLFLFLLILFPTLLMICPFSLNTKAGPAIPEPDPDNGWHWEVDVGTEIYFEGEFIITNVSSGEVTGMWKDIWIYNITSIENVTIDWLGVHDFSQVNATRCYHNITAGPGVLEPYDNSQEFALFGFNSTDPITHRIRAGQNGMPFLLPINGTALDVTTLAPIINETFYDPLGQMGMYNNFTYYSSDFATKRIQFWHDIDNYYTDGYYYDNGTMAYGEAFLWINMDGDPIYVNATMWQVSDYDITDEVEWGVNVGDEFPITLYMGSSDLDDAQELIVNITSIDTDELFNKSKNSFSDEDYTYMVYRCVYADIFEWNGTDYEFMQNTIISAANNFYPQYYDEIGGDPIMPFLWPINIPQEDYEFMWNLDTLRIWEGMRYDTINIIENGLLEFELSNSTGLDYVKIQIDKTTGVTQSLLNINPGGVMYLEVRSQTLVDWSVGTGDVIYYKNNEKEFWDRKVNILGIGSVYANMSDYFAPMGIPIPSGQPEYQFFSYLYAEIYEWDYNTNSWDYDDSGPFAIANTYWPISPLQFEFAGPPIIMPEGTTSSELSNLFDFYSSVFDVVTYSPGHILMRNSTLDKEWNFYFDETSGKLTMMYGWMNQPGSGEGWQYMSIYPKFYQALPPGTNTFTLSTDFPTGLTVDMEVEVGGAGAGAALIYNYFSMNPVNVSIPNGTALAYFDQLFTERSLIVGNITMTLTLPSSLDLDTMIFIFYAFNMSGTEQWDPAPPEFYLYSVTYNFAANTITINMEAWDRGVLSVMAYLTEADKPEEIPGYNIFFISLLIIITSGLILKKVRKNR